jgi:hypothetical protein
VLSILYRSLSKKLLHNYCFLFEEKSGFASPENCITVFADFQLYIGSTIKTELSTPNPAVNN